MDHQIRNGNLHTTTLPSIPRDIFIPYKEANCVRYQIPRDTTILGSRMSAYGLVFIGENLVCEI